jgi:hypothetical protein
MFYPTARYTRPIPANILKKRSPRVRDRFATYPASTRR